MAAPEFVRMAAHPLRWRLLTELAGGDHRVRELTERVGEPQNLVSYHLRLLRDGGLVRSRRSTFDGRDTYYHLDLDRCSAPVSSAGSRPKPLRPNTVRVLREEFGVDISGRTPRHLDSVRKRFDHVITLCDKVREVCPEFAGTPIHWSIPEPAGYPEFVTTAIEIDTRVRHLLPVLAKSKER